MLHKDTLITTSSGLKKISSIVSGERIMTKEGPVSVIKNEKKVSPLMRIRTQEFSIFCSPEHEFLLFDEETKFFYFAPIQQVGVKLIKFTPMLLEVIPVIDIDKVSSGDAYRIHLTEDHTLIINDQIVARNN